MEIIGYIGALLIGLSLGLLGSGGSILTVPILVYLFHINPVTATAYSLFVVGTTSLAGAAKNYQKGMLHLKTALIFSVPSIIAVYATRRFIIPALPETIFSLPGFAVTKGMAIMLFFALVMLLSAYFMIRGQRREAPVDHPSQFKFPLILIEGAVVGMVTGLVGAGGGFLIIPALVLLTGLPMKTAVGTSLLIIALKSLIGFLGDVETLCIGWPFLLTFTAVSLIGMLAGARLSSQVESRQLKKLFGWFVLLMAFYIIIKELV